MSEGAITFFALHSPDALSSRPMPSLDHELLIELFRNQPELAAQLLRDALHLELPAYTEARLASSDLTELVPTEFRADAVVLLIDGKPVLGVSSKLSSRATSASDSVGPLTSLCFELVNSAPSSSWC